jgi:hypothetical protein
MINLAQVKITISIQEHRNRQLLVQINKAYSDEPAPEEKKLLSKQKSYHRRLVKGQW